MNKLILTLASILVLACTSSKDASTGKVLKDEAIAFDYINLQLLSIKGDEREIKLTDEIDINLYVDVKGEAYSGKSGCNRYFGSVQQVGKDKLIFKPGGSTEMMCDSLTMSWEARYYNALLGKTFFVYTNETNAVFTEKEGTTVLSFKKVEALQE
jgi:heat shock protein HslJ